MESLHPRLIAEPYGKETGRADLQVSWPSENRCAGDVGEAVEIKAVDAVRPIVFIVLVVSAVCALELGAVHDYRSGHFQNECCFRLRAYGHCG